MSKDNKGQQKTHTMTNPTTGESREITQADWREHHKEYEAEGFVRPEDVEETSDSDSGSGSETGA